METTIARAEHEEFRRRMEEHHKRQDKRLSLLEEKVEETHTLAVSVEKLATNMENMWQELTRQTARLEALENRDGEAWRHVKYYVLTALLSLALGIITKSV